MLRDCELADGPTEVVPGSHRSGRIPDYDRVDDADFGYDGRRPVAVTAAAGDVILFASDLWHRGRPADNGRGRLFLQCHYGRRDIAQRILTTDAVHHLSADAIARAEAAGGRARTLVGLHGPYFYDG
jgi:ectoine hydroxylase-related dioxygenase (phytanoyl-CoA dioxygenase family)